METLNVTDATISEIVAADYRTAEVFKRNGIDFCCGGKKTVSIACTEKGLEPERIFEELNKAVEEKPKNLPYNEWSGGVLSDHIVQVHHGYIRQNIPLISALATKVNRVHGAHEPRLNSILEFWDEIAADLSMHLQKEELMLFPYIRKIETAMQNNTTVSAPVFGSVANPITMMEAEHDKAGILMNEIRMLSDNYQAPDYACNSYRVLFAKLKEFEEDLHTHVHLENNILFPLAKKIEQKVILQ